MMAEHAYICDAVRTPIGRYGGALSSVRADDLAAIPIAELLRRQPQLESVEIDDVVLGRANQAGEDNRNVARMASLLAGLRDPVPGSTVNRLCGSGMNAISIAAQTIKSGEADLIIAGGVESMSRAPFVMSKAGNAFSRSIELHDTTLGWRFVNPEMERLYGTDSMAETAENVAEEYGISRRDQDVFAAFSQQKATEALQNGSFKAELCPVEIKPRKGPIWLLEKDEHPRPDTTIEVLAKLKPIVRSDGTVTAGNASGINDGACAVLIASEQAVQRFGLKPMARIVASAVTGVAPRVMGIGPISASQKALWRAGIAMDDVGVIELNEAFAAQALAVLRELGLPDDAPQVNRYGGAIALGHPLGMSGARLITTAAYQLGAFDQRYALCSMCIGVGQGIAAVLQRIEY